MLVKEPWFGPKKQYGWGWKPVRWQGWAVMAAYVLIILAVLVDIVPREQATVVSIAATALLLVVARITGGKPGGGWGS